MLFSIVWIFSEHFDLFHSSVWVIFIQGENRSSNDEQRFGLTLGQTCVDMYIKVENDRTISLVSGSAPSP